MPAVSCYCKVRSFDLFGEGSRAHNDLAYTSRWVFHLRAIRINNFASLFPNNLDINNLDSSLLVEYSLKIDKFPQNYEVSKIINEKGCLPAGEEWLERNLLVVAGVAVGISFLQVR